jgi:hypothetical protein
LLLTIASLSTFIVTVCIGVRVRIRVRVRVTVRVRIRVRGVNSLLMRTKRPRNKGIGLDVPIYILLNNGLSIFTFLLYFCTTGRSVS